MMNNGFPEMVPFAPVPSAVNAAYLPALLALETFDAMLADRRFSDDECKAAREEVREIVAQYSPKA